MFLCKNKNLFSLPEYHFIGGDYKEVFWNITDVENNSNVDIQHLTMLFTLIEYDNRYGDFILSKNCDVVEEDGLKYFKLPLLVEDTKDLSGQFIYQLTIAAPNGKQESMQGLMYIGKNLNPQKTLR